MAFKEGRCPNCGSLLHIDTNVDNGHCLFCDAVFPAQKSFEIAANPEGVEFPNLPQPKYEGPAMTKAATPYPVFPAAKTAPRKKQAGKPAPEPYVHKKVEIPDVRLPMKSKILIALVLVLIAGAFAAITVPVSISRDKDRQAILAALKTASPIALDTESETALRRTDNSYLMIATGETVTREQAVALFKAFCQERQKVRGSTGGSADQIYSGNTLRLAHASGGFLIDSPTDAELSSGSAVKELT